MKHALTSWLGLVLLFAAAGAVLCVDVGRELLADTRKRYWWIDAVAYVAVPVLLFLAAGATLVRIFSLV